MIKTQLEGGLAPIPMSKQVSGEKIHLYMGLFLVSHSGMTFYSPGEKSEFGKGRNFCSNLSKTGSPRILAPVNLAVALVVEKVAGKRHPGALEGWMGLRVSCPFPLVPRLLFEIQRLSAFCDSLSMGLPRHWAAFHLPQNQKGSGLPRATIAQTKITKAFGTKKILINVSLCGFG